MFKSKHCKVKHNFENISRSRTTLKQADNAVSAKAQARFSSFFRDSLILKSWPWLLIGPVCTVYCSDLHCLLVRSWLLIGPISGTLFRWGNFEPAERVIYRYHVEIFRRRYAQFLQPALKIVGSHFCQKKLTVTFHLYWFHSFMNLASFCPNTFSIIICNISDL